MSVNLFVDASHAGEKLTYLSHTEILIYVNNTLLEWLSKRQKTVKNSTFGDKLIAARTSMEKVKSLLQSCYGLVLLLIVQPTCSAKNKSVVKSTSRAEITLSNKHQLIYCHSVRNSISAGWMRVLKEPGGANMVEMFTKQLPIKRREDILNSIYSCDDKSFRDKN